jgi:LacI family transcriptional regulator
LEAIEELAYRPNAVARNLAKRRAGASGPDDKLFSTKFERMTTTILQEHEIATSSFFCPPQTETGVARALAREVTDNRATVIIASSDKLAINTIHGLYAACLRVPDDCAVTGFGDIPPAQWVQPSLTTLRIPVKALADKIVTELFKEETLNQPAVPRDMPGGRLVVRRSC